MTTETPESSTRPSRFRRWARIVGIVVGTLLVLIGGAFVLTALPDLLREAPEPAVVSRVRSGPAERESTPSSVREEPAHDADSVASPLKIPAGEPLIGPMESGDEELERRRREIDTMYAAWAMQWNDFVARAGALNHEEATATLALLQQGRESVVGAYRIWRDDFAIDPKDSRLDPPRPVIMRMYKRFSDAELENHVRHGRWREAAELCELEDEWNQAIYYWRKEGVHGRWRIAAGAVERKLREKNMLDFVSHSLPYPDPIPLVGG
jgi:hypothetical protein